MSRENFSKKKRLWILGFKNYKYKIKLNFSDSVSKPQLKGVGDGRSKNQKKINRTKNQLRWIRLRR